jgi:hypothetical protein
MQAIQSTGREATCIGAEVLAEVLDQEGDLDLALAKWRHRQRDALQAVVQILTEAPPLEELRELAMRRRQETDIHLDGLRAADPLELPRLKNAQQLGLQLEGQLADLVQEDESPRPRARKSPGLADRSRR